MAAYSRQLDSIQRAAARLATALGHTLTPWEDETAWSSVATCPACGYYAVAESQPDEEGPIYGSATQVQCRGSMTIPLWMPSAITDSKGVPPHDRRRTPRIRTRAAAA